MEQEGLYLTALQEANGVWVEGDRLRITTDQVTLYYTRLITEPEAPIVTPTPTPAGPTAVIIAPSDENVGQVITYDASLSTSNAEITSYRWWFTGGETDEGVVVERTYKKTGAIDSILTITDAIGQKSEASVKTNIHAYLTGPEWDIEDGPATINFGDEVLSGFAGCNDYSASYTADTEPGQSNEISIGSITKTQMECDEDVMEEEDAFLSNLRSATSYRININRLTISPNELVMVFYPAP